MGRCIRWRISSAALTAGLMVMYALRAIAGPPSQSDDPEPTGYGHYEIYSFNKGIAQWATFRAEAESTSITARLLTGS